MTIYGIRKPSEEVQKLYNDILEDFPKRYFSVESASLCISEDKPFDRDGLCFNYFSCVYQIMNETSGFRECGFDVFKELKEGLEDKL